MTDWLIIATGAVTLMGAFISKIGDGFSQKIGEDIYEFLKRRYKKNKEASNILTSFSKNQNRYKHPLADIIKETIENDTEFANELLSLVEKAQIHKTSIVNQTATGTGIAQSAGDGSSASVNLEQVYKSAPPKKKK